jgi:hypothetical protein
MGEEEVAVKLTDEELEQLRKFEELEEDYSDSTPLEWQGEVWLDFRNATEVIRSRLGVSTGLAQRTLRELCATGDVRALNSASADALNSASARDVQPSEPYIIKPSKWRDNEPDLDVDGWEYCVLVSDEDLSYWLDKKQPNQGKEQKPKLLIGKVPRVIAGLVKLYPQGVPDPAHCPRKELQGQILKIDPGLRSLDPGTLKAAIDRHNADRKQSETIGLPIGSD